MNCEEKRQNSSQSSEGKIFTELKKKIVKNKENEMQTNDKNTNL